MIGITKAKNTNVETGQTQPISPQRRTHGDERARKRSRIIVPILAIGLVIFSIVNVYIGLQKEPLPSEIEGAVFYEDLSNEIVEGPITYDIQPPPGGPNAGVVQDCGLYRVPVQNKHAVASLANGAVWIAYDPDLPAEDVDNLRSFAEDQLFVLLAPYPGLDSPVVLTAWGVQTRVDDTLDPSIPGFIREYTNGEQAPIQNGTCSGGVTVPVR